MAALLASLHQAATGAAVGSPMSARASIRTAAPAPGFTGTDSFTYQDSDGTLESNVATVTIDVIAPTTSGSSSALPSSETPGLVPFALSAFTSASATANIELGNPIGSMSSQAGLAGLAGSLPAPASACTPPSGRPQAEQNRFDG